jgi:hypothetical protein
MQKPKTNRKANDITKESGLLSLFSGTRGSTRLQGIHDLNVSLPGSNRESVLLGMILVPLSDRVLSPFYVVVSRAELPIRGAKESACTAFPRFR